MNHEQKDLAMIRESLDEAQSVLNRFATDDAILTRIQKAGVVMAEAVKSGRKIFSCGNGGSMCDAMHFAEELSGRFRNNRVAIPAMAISDPSHITCVGNDYGFEYIFSRYIEAIGKAGDVLLAISTSGNSVDIIRATEAAHSRNMNVVALTGKTGGNLAGMADVEIRVDYHGYSDRIQEIHIKVIHILIQVIESYW